MVMNLVGKLLPIFTEFSTCTDGNIRMIDEARYTVLIGYLAIEKAAHNE